MSTVQKQRPQSREGQPACRVFDGWAHQLAAYKFASERESSMLAMAMGTGKSWVAVALVNNLRPASTLILCPVSVMGVWRREVEKHTPQGAKDRLRLAILDQGSMKQKVEKAQACLRLAEAGGRQGIVVINYESARQPDFAAWAAKQDWGLVVCDESHRIKSPSGKTAKFVGSLTPRAKRRVCLTGTPMPHSPLDIFSQYRFLDPRIFGRWFGKFRARYAHCDRMFPSKVLKWINQEELAGKVAGLAYQVGSEVLDLPPAMHEQRSYELSGEAARCYRQLKNELITEIKSGVVTVDNALVKLVRLQQITSGYLPLESGEHEELNDHKSRLLADILEDLPAREPVVVFCKFVHDLGDVRRVAERLGRRYGELSGRQKDLTSHSTMPPDVDVLGVQWQSGGVGVDLTRAAYCVLYSHTFSLGDYDQALARTNRPGQTRAVRYYHLLAEGTVDEQIYRAINARREIVQAVLSGLTSLGDE